MVSNLYCATLGRDEEIIHSMLNMKNTSRSTSGGREWRYLSWVGQEWQNPICLFNTPPPLLSILSILQDMFIAVIHQKICLVPNGAQMIQGWQIYPCWIGIGTQSDGHLVPLDNSQAIPFHRQRGWDWRSMQPMQPIQLPRGQNEWVNKGLEFRELMKHHTWQEMDFWFRYPTSSHAAFVKYT